MTSLRHNPVCPDDVILGKDKPLKGEVFGISTICSAQDMSHQA